MYAIQVPIYGAANNLSGLRVAGDTFHGADLQVPSQRKRGLSDVSLERLRTPMAYLVLGTNSAMRGTNSSPSRSRSGAARTLSPAAGRKQQVASGQKANQEFTIGMSHGACNIQDTTYTESFHFIRDLASMQAAHLARPPAAAA